MLIVKDSECYKMDKCEYFVYDGEYKKIYFYINSNDLNCFAFEFDSRAETERAFNIIINAYSLDAKVCRL